MDIYPLKPRSFSYYIIKTDFRGYRLPAKIDPFLYRPLGQFLVMPSLPKDCGKLLSGRQSFSGSGLPPQDGHTGRVSAGERGSILLSRPLPRQPNCVEGLGARPDVELLLDGLPATKRWRGGHSSKVCSWWWPLICSQPRRRRATRLRVKAQPSGQQRRRPRTPFSPWGVVCVNFPALSEGVLQVKTMSWLLRTSGSGTQCCILVGGIV